MSMSLSALRLSLVTARPSAPSGPSAPGQMAAPTITVTSQTAASIQKAADPSDNGSAITRFDLQYRLNGGSWVYEEGATFPFAVPGLSAGDLVEASTRAYNDEGAGSWSPIASASTWATPALSAPLDSQTGATTSSWAVTVNSDRGTLSWVVTTSATTPSVTQIEAGEDHTGAAAAADGSRSITEAGSEGGTTSGLAASTAYYTHWAYRIGTETDTISADGFTTDASGDAQLTNPQLAANTSGIVDWGSNHPFINRFKQARAMFGNGGAISWEDLRDASIFDADGYPTKMGTTGDGLSANVTAYASVFAWTDGSQLADLVSYRAGDYVFLYDGTGTFDIALGGTETSNTPGRIEFTTDGQSDIWVRCTAITPGDYPTNFRLYRAADEAAGESGEIWNPDYLELTKDFRVLRFMPWSEEFGNPLQLLADFHTLDSVTWNNSKGGMVPIEAVVDLCNRNGIEPWIVVPYLCMEPGISDNYALVKHWAAYVHANLDPRLNCYVEYSNEMWNGAFPQTPWLSNLATTAGWPSGQFARRAMYQMKLTVEMGEIIETEVGAANFDRFKIIAGSQRDSGSQTNWLLNPTDWDSEEPGHPAIKDYIHAVAVTQYFGSGVTGNAGFLSDLETQIALDATAARTWLYDELNDVARGSSIPDMQAEIGVHRGQIDTFNASNGADINLLAYEGGSHIYHSAGSIAQGTKDWLKDFYNSQEMYDLYDDALAAWQAHGDGPFMCFTLCNDGDPNSGYWGHFEYVGQINDDPLPKRAQWMLDNQGGAEASATWWGEAHPGDDRYQGGYVAQPDPEISAGTLSQSALGSSDATGSITLNRSGGTLRIVGSEHADMTAVSDPSIAEVKAGQVSGGGAADWTLTIASPQSGANALAPTGLTLSRVERAWAVYSADGVDSAVFAFDPWSMYIDPVADVGDPGQTYVFWSEGSVQTTGRDGTGGAPADTDPVGRILSLHDNTTKAEAIGDAARATFIADDGSGRAAWDGGGVAAFLTDAIAAGPQFRKALVGVAYRQDAAANAYIMASTAGSLTADNNIGLQHWDASDELRVYRSYSTSLSYDYSSTSTAGGTKVAALAYVDFNDASAGNRITDLYINSATSTDQVGLEASAFAANMLLDQHSLFCRQAGTTPDRFLDGPAYVFFFTMVDPATLDAGTIEGINFFLAGACGSDWEGAGALPKPVLARNGAVQSMEVPASDPDTLEVTLTTPAVFGSTPSIDASKIEIIADRYGPVGIGTPTVSGQGTNSLTVTLPLIYPDVHGERGTTPARTIAASETVFLRAEAGWYSDENGTVVPAVASENAYYEPFGGPNVTNSSAEADPATAYGASYRGVAFEFDAAEAVLFDALDRPYVNKGAAVSVVATYPVEDVSTLQAESGTGAINGCMKDPVSGAKQAFDDRVYSSGSIGYDAAMQVTYPVSLTAGESLAKARAIIRAEEDWGGNSFIPQYILQTGGLVVHDGALAANQIAPRILDPNGTAPTMIDSVASLVSSHAENKSAAGQNWRTPENMLMAARCLNLSGFQDSTGQGQTRRRLTEGPLISWEDGYGQFFCMSITDLATVTGTDHLSTAQKVEIWKGLIRMGLECSHVSLTADGATNQGYIVPAALYTAAIGGDLTALSGDNSIKQIVNLTAQDLTDHTTAHTDSAVKPWASHEKTVTAVSSLDITFGGISWVHAGRDGPKHDFDGLIMERVSDGQTARIAAWNRDTKVATVAADMTPGIAPNDVMFFRPNAGNFSEGDVAWFIRGAVAQYQSLGSHPSPYTGENWFANIMLALQTLGVFKSEWQRIKDYVTACEAGNVPEAAPYNWPECWGYSTADYDGTSRTGAAKAFYDAYWSGDIDGKTQWVDASGPTPLAIDSADVISGHSILDRLDDFLEPGLTQLNGSATNFHNSTGPVGGMGYRWTNDPTAGESIGAKARLTNGFSAPGDCDTHMNIEANADPGGGVEWSISALFGWPSSSIANGVLWMDHAASPGGCSIVALASFWQGDADELFDADWRSRAEDEAGYFETLRAGINTDKDAGTPTVNIIPLAELYMAIYDDLQLGGSSTLLAEDASLTMGDFFNDNIHQSQLGKWVTALCAFMVLRRRPASEWPKDITGPTAPSPPGGWTTGLADALRDIVTQVVTVDEASRTGWS